MRSWRFHFGELVNFAVAAAQYFGIDRIGRWAGIDTGNSRPTEMIKRVAIHDQMN